MKLSEEVEAFLKRTNICVLATTGPGDAPHAIPMWYLYDDGVIIITTSSRSQKSKNVERNGKAMVVLDTRAPPYHAIMIKGDAEIGPPLTRERELETAVRYLGEERAKAFMAHYDTGAGDDATILIRPTKVIEYRGG